MYISLLGRVPRWLLSWFPWLQSAIVTSGWHHFRFPYDRGKPRLVVQLNEVSFLPALTPVVRCRPRKGGNGGRCLHLCKDFLSMVMAMAIGAGGRVGGMSMKRRNCRGVSTPRCQSGVTGGTDTSRSARFYQ